MADSELLPRYESLKDLISSLPQSGTPTPAYPGNLKTRYAKREEPLFKNGVAVYWKEVPLRKEGLEDHGFCDLFEKHVVGTMKPRFGKALGALCCLPKFVHDSDIALGKQNHDL
ncbi:hypothetical protein QQP08_023811 [Theobroma cacao]|nr:hypothetical protein QQP08_023811 [Theobroma cacao]